MIYLSFYLEINGDGATFFTHDKLTPMDKIDVRAAFVGCGGLSVNERVLGNKRFIISKWDSLDGYDNWLAHPASQIYITTRDAYNKLHNIQSEFIAIIPESEV